ncbi:carbohydrate-binding protein [Sphaerimonospora cavernae]|uniref:Carbohydrate-binding protein n=1 Tax=Sphaerimonospora cavernae TaxID=1740611 RepID=A0ABV6U952_9ACTN
MDSRKRSAVVAVPAAVIVIATSLTAVPAASAMTRTAAAQAVAETPTPQPVFEPPDDQERKSAMVSADKALLANAALLHKTADDQFKLVRSIAGTRGLQYLTYQRSYRGLPVYGGDVIVSTDKTGQVVDTVVTGQQATVNVNPKATVKADAAAATARAELATVESTSTPEPLVHATTDTPRLAWEVVVTGMSKQQAPSVLHVYVDARTGKVIDTWDEVRDGIGHGYHNGTVTIDTSYIDGLYYLIDPNRPGIRCDWPNGTSFGKTVDIWGNGSGTDLETACVDVMYAAQQEWDMLRDWLGRNGHNGSGGSFPARVGLNAVNAYWNGSYTQFGHSSAGNQLTSMDVVGHEYGHAIFQFSGSGAGSGNEEGGLNESTGDIFGALTEHYADNPNDPPDYLVGEKVDLAGRGPIRNMYNPSALGDPNCYSSSIPRTEVHAAAGPQNHWFYLLAEGSNPGGGKPASPTCDSSTVTGIGIQKAGQIFMGGLNLKTAPWTHAKARVATLRSALSLFPDSCTEFNAVKAAWGAVSVNAQSGEPTCTAPPANDFSLSISPFSVTVRAGQSASATLSTRVTSGSAQPLTLSANAPSGVTVTLSPATITAGRSSTVTIATSSSAAAGTYTIGLNAAGASASHATSFSLVVIGRGATTWAPWTAYSAGNVVTYDGVRYHCLRSHVSLPGWEPPNVPALWQQEWSPWTVYSVGDVVIYGGVSYRCLHAHTGLPGWEPPNVPALWQRL